jgi:hypothetical protein
MYERPASPVRLVGSMRLGGTIASLTLVAALAVAGPAAAAKSTATSTPGVYIDPGSPAGKQYSVPLSVLRGQANGHVKPGGGEPSFGSGITPAPASAPATTTATPAVQAQATHHAHHAHHARIKRAHHRRHRVRAHVVRRSPVSDAVEDASLDHSQSTAFPVILVTALVLLCGLALGGGFRAVRRSRQG